MDKTPGTTPPRPAGAGVDAMMETNRANWDARAGVHEGSRFYDVAGLLRGEDHLAPFEYAELGDLRGRDLVHLQCHLGTDTVCLARAGARAVGLDFSEESVARARRIAEDAGLDIEYVRANVYDAVSALGGRTFDVVHTGKGALNWLPDLGEWARVAAALLRPGGMLHVVEFHPLFTAGADEQPDLARRLVLDWDYLATGEASRFDGGDTYTDGPAVTGMTETYEWSYGLGDVVGAVLDAGLRLVSLAEHDISPWARWEGMRPDGRWWRMPEGAPKLPLLFSLRAVRDA
ncbi:class I SAM-dependent methyltransferase [Streptoalloteichus tenebrarius]|nr:class I SAM-dependent methyltransferase [Streptoalloteichus tenebrarius]